VDPEYGRHYRELYEKHWWWRSREEAILQVLRRQFGARRNLNILDIGCGDGVFFDRLTEFGDVEGIEPAAALVDPAGPHRARITVAPFDEEFRPGKRYSLILMLDVLEHLDRPAQALRHAAALLEPGGLLLITVPAFRLLWTSHDVLNQHRERFTKGSFRGLARQAGVHVLEARYFFLWLFPVKLIARGREWLAPTKPKVPEPPPRWLNGFLQTFSRADNRVALAAPFPVGSSLLVLATNSVDEIRSHPDRISGSGR
jgi:2-polyprenyl-3-methyl-5-hydroxy-6-metoxy-1,4-benzoquinol methylase